MGPGLVTIRAWDAYKKAGCVKLNALTPFTKYQKRISETLFCGKTGARPPPFSIDFKVLTLWIKGTERSDARSVCDISPPKVSAF